MAPHHASYLGELLGGMGSEREVPTIVPGMPLPHYCRCQPQARARPNCQVLRHLGYQPVCERGRFNPFLMAQKDKVQENAIVWGVAHNSKRILGGW